MSRWHIMGDSHIHAFQWASEQRLIDWPCEFVQVNGATAVGLRNPNSVTNALETFLENLLSSSLATIPVLHLGEVDCGFVIWYRSMRYGESIETQLDMSVSAYFSFIDRLRAAGYAEIVISGGTLPTIRDDTEWGKVANLRREVREPLLRRTRLTIRYNARLAEEAARRGLPYIDIAEDVLDPATGVVADGFRHPDAFDHHLDPAKSGPLWAAQLNALSRRRASSSGE